MGEKKKCKTWRKRKGMGLFFFSNFSHRILQWNIYEWIRRWMDVNEERVTTYLKKEEEGKRGYIGIVCM